MRVSSATWLTFSIGLGFFGLLLTGCGGGGGSGSGASSTAAKTPPVLWASPAPNYTYARGSGGSVDEDVPLLMLLNDQRQRYGDGKERPSYALKMIGADVAHGKSFTVKDVTVAVIDSEFDNDHPDLEPSNVTPSIGTRSNPNDYNAYAIIPNLNAVKRKD